MYPLSESDNLLHLRQSSVLCEINFENSQSQMFADLTSKADLWLKTRPSSTSQEHQARLESLPDTGVG